MAKRRNKYTPEQKVQIIKKHLVDNVPLSDLCDQHGLHPTVFHRWQKAFFENGTKAFETDRDHEKARLEKKVAGLEAKISKKNDVLSEQLVVQLVPYFQVFCHKKQEKCYPIRGVIDIVAER